MTPRLSAAAELRGILERFPPRTLGVLVLPGFQALDLWGPLEMFGNCAPAIAPLLVGHDLDAVASVQGPRVLPDVTLSQAPRLDLVLVPGGKVGRHRADPVVAEWLRSAAADAEVVMSVCNGADLLATAGLLDGRRATSNKALFTSIAARHPRVEWVRHARWVEDGKFVTSSGVSAGIDMALAVIAHLAGEEVAETLAALAEYERHPDPGWDPFSALHGLEPSD